MARAAKRRHQGTTPAHGHRQLERQHQTEVNQRAARGGRMNTGDRDSGPRCDGARSSASGRLPVRKRVAIGAILPPLGYLRDKS